MEQSNMFTVHQENLLCFTAGAEHWLTLADAAILIFAIVATMMVLMRKWQLVGSAALFTLFTAFIQTTLQGCMCPVHNM